MRLLHVSDWHLGVTLGRLARQSDHETVLDEIVDVADDFAPHLIVHSGDLFDGFRPPVESMRLAMQTLRRLADRAPVVIVAGNHDSRPLFRLFDEIMAFTGTRGRIRFLADPTSADDPLSFPGDEDGEHTIRLAAMPFLHPNMLVDIFQARPQEWTGEYADGVRTLQRMQRRGLEDNYDHKRHINLYTAHLHVGGAQLGKSERTVHVSTDYATDVEALPPVSYAAFGHIHKPQRLPGPTPGRYAGSPIQIDYGEIGEQKSVVTVDAAPGKSARIEPIDVSGGRPLVRHEGTLDELRRLAEDDANQAPAIFTATVVTDEPTSGLVDEIARLFPNADLHVVHNRVMGQKVEAVHAADEELTDINFRDLFSDYLATRDGLGDKLRHRLGDLFDELLTAAETETEPSLNREVELAAGSQED